MRTWRDRDRARMAWRASRCQSERGPLATTSIQEYERGEEKHPGRKMQEENDRSLLF